MKEKPILQTHKNIKCKKEYFMYTINVAGKNLNYQWELYVPENVDVDKYIKDWLKAEYGIDDTYFITYGKMS